MPLLASLRRHRVIRHAARIPLVAVAILAVVIVSTLTVDLGPAVRGLAERAGSKKLKRPVHIGSLAIRILRGRVELNGLTIDGLHPKDRPFFTAQRLSVSLDWSKVLQRRPEFIITSVELVDWWMLVEKWDGEDNFPNFKDDDEEDTPAAKGPRRFTTTLQSLRAWRGRFTYEDHEAPWGVDAPNMDLNITHGDGYRGEATFTGGTVRIQRFVPMWANMRARFRIDGSDIHLDRIDLDSDGATTVASGDVDLSHWPEQTYAVRSQLKFGRMRELFFADETWNLSGDGRFAGSFHLFKGGHNLVGSFESPMAGLNALQFPSLYGSLRWTRQSFEVTDAGSKFFGGDARYAFSITPRPGNEPSRARFEAEYSGVDLAALCDFQQLAGLRAAGSATGRNLLEWPTGQFREHRGDGAIVITPPAGAEPMAASLDGARAADPGHSRHEWGPHAPAPLPAHLPVAGELVYHYDPDEIWIDRGWLASERSHVAVSGSTAWGGESRFDFHVTSRDWQESDQVLAGILSDVSSPKKPVTFGGRGEFDGVMTGRMRNPRVEGLFTGEDLRAWDTLWGDGSATIVIENEYVRVKDAHLRRERSEIRAEGMFSLGYPRDDGGEEIDARFWLVDRDVDSLRHAFEIDDYPVSGLLSGEFHLTGQYERPVGFGAMTIHEGRAYGEPFQNAAASLRFDGAGVRLDGVTIAKGSGAMTGAAYVGWDSTYSFNVSARRIPVDQIAAFRYPNAQPTGLVDFSATGSGKFDAPRYDVRYGISDLFVGEEAVGQLTGTLAIRGKEVSGELDIASPRLAVTGTGRISLAAHADAEVTFRFHDSSLDPYVRLFVPKLSPFTTAVASGTVRVVGELSDLDNLLVDATVDKLEMRLFDYALRNAAPLRLALDHDVVRLDDVQVVGEDTRLRVGGTVQLRDQRIAVRATGDANLGILQGFLRDVRGSGRAELSAAIDGPLRQPLFSGSATIVAGRVRHLALPNALDDINGVIRFDSTGVRLDDVSAMMGGGRVQFGGRVALDGYLPGELNVTVRGEDMRLRYPEGVRSIVDADLTVRGNVKAPTLGGLVTVKTATWSRRIDPTGNIFDFGAPRASAGVMEGPVAPAAVPLRLDLQVLVPSTLRVENNLARLVARADLQLRGTYDRPILFGHAEVDRGEVTFEGRRYVVTKGAIDFTNPTRIEPFFDVEAETRVRVPGQTYRVTVRAAGTSARVQPTLESDPPLPAADVLALLFSDVRRTQGVGNAELSALQNPTQLQTDILTTRATQLLANPISSEVGRVVEHAFGVDTFQLSPSLLSPDPLSESTTRVNPSARVTIGKRISDRLYLTFSRSLASAINDQILLLEYDQSDRLSFILSRNEDATYAIEVRVRHTF